MHIPFCATTVPGPPNLSIGFLAPFLACASGAIFARVSGLALRPRCPPGHIHPPFQDFSLQNAPLGIPVLVLSQGLPSDVDIGGVLHLACNSAAEAVRQNFIIADFPTVWLVGERSIDAIGSLAGKVSVVVTSQYGAPGSL
jgi:hypothetical protein